MPDTRSRPGILVVDDDQGFAQTMSDVLEARGYRVEVAANGRESLAAVTDSRFEVIMLDLRLPDTDGIELLDRFRELSPSSSVIILTGHASIETAVRALSRGAFGYLEKPYRIERLFLLIEQALSNCQPPISNSQFPTPDLQSAISDWQFPIVVFNAYSGVVLDRNQAFQNVFPTPDGAALDLLPVDAEPDWMARHLTSLGQEGQATALLQRRGARPQWFRLVSSLQSTGGNRALGLLVDVTRDHELHQTSTRLQQYFEAVFTNIGVGVMIVDSDHTIRQANPAFARFYGTPGAVLAGQRCHDIIHRRKTPCHLHGEVCPIKNCLATGTTCRVQHIHTDRQGQRHCVESTMTPLRDEAGTVVSFVAIYADITEVKQAQEESEAESRELERLNRELTAQRARVVAQAEALKKANLELMSLSSAKSDFVSMVSHELRTPLTAISEGINLVADQTLGPVSTNQSKFLTIALNNARRLSELINDLLDLSKIEAGRVELRLSPVDLHRIVDETCATFAAAARQKSLLLETAKPSGPVRVLADERMVRRILNNLLSNAVKFTSRGRISVRTESADTEAVVTVSDTGIGIPEAERSRIFDKFYQVQSTDGSRPPGTGLGLALTREMVLMNRGRIWFDSRPGQGTDFSFSLPVDTAESKLCSLPKTDIEPR